MEQTLKRVWFYSMALAVLATCSLWSLNIFIGDMVFAEDQGFNWYYWKRTDPDFWSRASMWGAYVLHQLFIWGVIAWAQKNRDKLRKRNKLHGINVIALAGTAFFVVLHYAQTAVFYDGLGQDLPVISSQMSVIFLLVIVLLLEAPRRGLFWGAGKSWFSRIRPILIRYHGYYFAWAITFTYWYHPMETTLGHLFGFLYTFFLFIQAGFIFTTVHTNRYWTVFLEVLVLVHGVVVALVAGQDFWPMFGFGFLFLLVMTQIHGLGLAKQWIWMFTAASVIAAIVVYSERGWDKANEVLRIPMIDYILVFLIGGILIAVQRLREARRG